MVSTFLLIKKRPSKLAFSKTFGHISDFTRIDYLTPANTLSRNEIVFSGSFTL